MIASVLPESLQARLDSVWINAEVAERWPGYRLLTVLAHGLTVSPHSDELQSDADSPLSRAEALVRSRNVTDWATQRHVAQWMAAYAEFGAKPKRTNPSSLALLKRVGAGLPRIDPVTDLYNAISISHAMPIGGEDFDAYVGHPRLTIAPGDETFDTTDKGEPVTTNPAPGEVIWRDDLGVTCRRWNWRQGVRTRITPATTSVIFILEELGAMPDEELLAAGDELIAGLRELSPKVAIATRLI